MSLLSLWSISLLNESIKLYIQYILYTDPDEGQAGSGLSLRHTHTCRSELQIDLHHSWQWCISEPTRWDSISTQLNSFPFNYCLSLIPNVSQIREEITMLGKTQSEFMKIERFSWKHHSVLYSHCVGNSCALDVYSTVGMFVCFQTNIYLLSL